MRWLQALAPAVLIFGAPALAQTAPAPSEQQQAVQFYREGMSAFRAGQFAQAIGRFKAADVLRPSASLSYDIAECYEKLADLRNARYYYEQYLRRAPNAEDRSKIEAALASIDAQLAAQAKEAAEKEHPSAAPLIMTEEGEAPPPPPPNRLASYVVIGVGVAGLVAGIALNAAANGSANNLTHAAAPQSGGSAGSEESTANTLWGASVVGYAVGGAALVTGGILFLVQTFHHPGPPPEEESQ